MNISSIFTTVLTVGITALLGNYIATLFQKRNNKTAMNQKKLEDETKNILAISKKISELSSSRRFAAQSLVDSLLDLPIDDSRITSLRTTYKEEVKKWNTSLSSLNIDLFSINLHHLAYELLEGTDNSTNVNHIDLHNTDYLPRGIHANFYEAHLLINEFLTRQPTNHHLLLRASLNLNSSFSSTRKMSQYLLQASNDKWTDMLNDYTDEFSVHNLEHATLLTLIRAVFHPKPHHLRVKRPIR